VFGLRTTCGFSIVVVVEEMLFHHAQGQHGGAK